jgi:hypothetical protein
MVAASKEPTADRTTREEEKAAGITMAWASGAARGISTQLQSAKCEPPVERNWGSWNCDCELMAK